MVTAMVVSESLSTTDALQSSASVPCHEHCQVMFLNSNCPNISIKNVSKNMCCAQNKLILSVTFCSASCPVVLTLMIKISSSGLNP